MLARPLQPKQAVHTVTGSRSVRRTDIVRELRQDPQIHLQFYARTQALAQRPLKAQPAGIFGDPLRVRPVTTNSAFDLTALKSTRNLNDGLGRSFSTRRTRMRHGRAVGLACWMLAAAGQYPDLNLGLTPAMRGSISGCCPS